MICQQLNDYLDGTLNPAEQLAFETHAEECHSCAEAIEVERQLMSRLRIASETLEHPAQTFTAAKPQVAAPSRSGRVALATAVAALLLAVAAMWVPNQSTKPTQIAQTTPVSVTAPPIVRLPAGQTAASIPSGDPNIQILMVFSNQTDATSTNPSLPTIDHDVP